MLQAVREAEQQLVADPAANKVGWMHKESVAMCLCAARGVLQGKRHDARARVHHLGASPT